MDLASIRDRLKTQDNRITAEPIFLVQQRERIYGMDFDRFDGNFVWITEDHESEADAEETARLDAADDAGEATPGWDRIGFIDRWEFVTCCFTEAAAQRYIDENRHNLTDPRIYVASGYRNHEWIAVRKMLMAEDRATRDRLADEILARFGFDSRLRKLGEESCELGAVIFRWLNRDHIAKPEGATDEALATEIADVELMIEFIRRAKPNLAALVDAQRVKQLQKCEAWVRSLPPPQPCDDCKGDGSVELTPPLFGYGAHVVACQYCGGTGRRS